MGDFKVIETGDGGDIVLLGNDMEIIDGLQNMLYLGLFGGNIEESTTTNPRQADEQAFDFWGNRLLLPFLPTLQFNSLLEKKLQEVTLSSSGRNEIINTINIDLEFMNEFAGVTVDVALVSADRIEISIQILQPGNLESNEFTYIWDATNAELTIE